MCASMLLKFSMKFKFLPSRVKCARNQTYPAQQNCAHHFNMTTHTSFSSHWIRFYMQNDRWFTDTYFKYSATQNIATISTDGIRKLSSDAVLFSSSIISLICEVDKFRHVLPLNQKK